MSEIDVIRSQMLQETWMPMTKKVGGIYFPRRKNKDLKVLFLLSDFNLNDYRLYLNENVTKQELIYAWNNDFLKCFRLETELGTSRVCGKSRYENSISNSNFELKDSFPFHIINLDFTSQRPNSDIGRIEKELKSIEKTLILQENIDFMLVYTTLLDNVELDLKRVLSESDKAMLRGWPGLDIDPSYLNSPIKENTRKIDGIIKVLHQLFIKYNYRCESTDRYHSLDNGNYIFSMGAILTRL